MPPHQGLKASISFARPTFHNLGHSQRSFLPRNNVLTSVQPASIKASTALNTATPLPCRYSTVSRGTAYEELCLQVLKRLGFSLSRVGGRSDLGIDLLGQWIPPTLIPESRISTSSSSSSSSAPDSASASVSAPSKPTALNALVQCKSHARKPGPQWVRELEGAVVGAPTEFQGTRTVGVLCAMGDVTEGVRAAVKRAERGVVWVKIVADEEGGGDAQRGYVKQIVWNKAVENLVGRELGTGSRYWTTGSKGKSLMEEVLLTVDGKIWDVTT